MISDIGSGNNEKTGRKSAADVWSFAHHAPVIPTIDSVYQQCNSRCYLSGHCAKNIPALEMSKLRKSFHGKSMEEVIHLQIIFIYYLN